ncbi:MAG: secondary thiamine-phosphate synthase enzyme YjbQ [Nanoarchaeota archaeon]|nr:secondary thiamine-phosphate synthase enzyme YjbQ [Nanoarchaeota archaeon]
MGEITLSTSEKQELIDVTYDIQKSICPVKEGICIVYCPHTTAAITINESADPDVKEDILTKLNDIIPDDPNYKHSEGNSDAHIKSSIIGCSETIMIKEGKLVLGTWQAIYFAEFDGPRKRKIFIKIIKD